MVQVGSRFGFTHGDEEEEQKSGGVKDCRGGEDGEEVGVT